MPFGDDTAKIQGPAILERNLLKRSAWAAFRQSIVQFQKEKVSPWIALRNTLGVALPLILGVGIGAVPIGIAMGIGALNVSYSDSHEPYVRRARRMFAASVLVGAAVFAGMLSGRNHWIAIVLAGSWAFAAGMLVALDEAAADLGVISLVTVVVFAAVPGDPKKALFSGLLALSGGLLQTFLSLAFWPLRRYVPERRALSEFYAELSRAAAAPVQASAAPPASAQSTHAQDSLATLKHDYSVEAERVRLLLSQAERMRLSMLTIARIRIRLQRGSAAGEHTEVLDRYFQICSRLLASIAAALYAGEPASAAPECLQELENLAESLRELQKEESSPVRAMSADARFQMDALTGQLRSAVDLAAYATPAGLAEFVHKEARQPWTLRLSGTLATLRANLTLGSAACRHAIRLAICVGLGDTLARSIGLQRAYWLPMTVAIVLKPDFTATFSRGVLRLTGTFAGLVFATVLFQVLPSSILAQVASVVVLVFVLRCFGPANYGIFVTAITALVVILIAMTGVAPKPVMAARGLNSAAGGAIALLAYWLWPTWEHTRISEVMAQLLDAYRRYFRVVEESYLEKEKSSPRERERPRVAARLARSNLEASIDRLSAEPGTSAESVRALGDMLASSHRLVHAVMALEAGLDGGQRSLPRESLRLFAADVERTLDKLAAALRGEPILEPLPDLREDHRALVQSGGSVTQQFALVNIETDRITNSLNTLSEQLRQWLAPEEESVKAKSP